MNEQDIVRRLLLRAGRDLPVQAPLAKALTTWVRSNAAWLLGSALPPRTGFRQLTALVFGAVSDAPVPHALQLAASLAEALALAPFDTRLLATGIALERCARARSLAAVIAQHGIELVDLLGGALSDDGEDASAAIRRSVVKRLGLLTFKTGHDGQTQVDVAWTVDRLLDRADATGKGLVEAMVGQRQSARLTLDDFAGRSDDLDYLGRLLAGAVRSRAAGVNILLHGAPGVGKTELARVLAAEAGAELFSVGEADEDGDEPSRWDRVTSLQLALRVAARRSGAVLLFDEMEDVIGGARPTAGGWFANREGSKIFVNRLIETNPAPIVWTTNAVGNIDPAILRRMSHVLELKLPSRQAAQRMLARVVEDEGVPADPELGRLVEQTAETASVLRVSVRSARLAGEPQDAVRSARSLVRALRGGRTPPPDSGPVDLDLFEADVDLAALFAQLAERGAPTDVSLLLTGPPGVGKTGLACHFARALDRPLIVRRASDLLSKWVGGTEANIAGAFEEARREGAVLLFDEVDSLLLDRSGATHSWEVTQVNELLTWLDLHPLPFVAATNHVHKLDAAALRRFVFKLELKPLGPERSDRAFRSFFGAEPPARLRQLRDLTAGDFAVVARQLRHAPATHAGDIVARLASEAAHRPGAPGRLGF